VYLDEETALAIRQLAETQKRSQADIIRDALGKYLKKTQRQIGRPSLPGVGAYRSGRADISQKAEALLKKAANRRR
jgi:hypothetical protein